MTGILPIDKPPEHTSFDVVARMRGIAKTRKIGHGGTLDPMATGVLPLFFGRATKACDILPDGDKSYTATFRLGITTDTQDITGTVLQQRPVTADKQQVVALLPRFTGVIRQTPPMYSAVKVNGQRLYDLARQGREVERPSREITVYRLDLLEWDEHSATYTIQADCSKGTYIRTLCHDMGEALGCGATLTALRRTKACGFGLSQCITLEQAAGLAQKGTLEQALLPIETAFASLPRLDLGERQTKQFCNGVKLPLGDFPAFAGDAATVFGHDGIFLGTAHPDRTQQLLRIGKLFYLPGSSGG